MSEMMIEEEQPTFFERLRTHFQRGEEEAPRYERKILDGRIERFLDENFNNYIEEYNPSLNWIHGCTKNATTRSWDASKVSSISPRISMQKWRIWNSGYRRSRSKQNRAVKARKLKRSK